MSMVRNDDRLERWLRQTARIERETSILFQSSTGDTNTTITTTRTDDFYIQIGVNGYSTWGSVIVGGLDSNGSPASTNLAFAADMNLRDTSNEYSSLTGLTLSGFSSDGTVTIRAISGSGQPKESLEFVKNIKCAMTRARFGQMLQPVGNVPIDSAIIVVYPNCGVRKSDRVVLDGERWEVKAINKKYDHMKMHTYDQLVVYAEDQTA